MPKAPPVSAKPPRPAPYEVKEEPAPDEVMCVDDTIVCAMCSKPPRYRMVDLGCNHTFHVSCYETMLSVNDYCGVCLMNHPEGGLPPAAWVKRNWISD